MTYNNQDPRQDKPLPSVEYTLKNIGWNIKVIAECLTKLVEMKGGEIPSQQKIKPSSQNYTNQNIPF